MTGEAAGIDGAVLVLPVCSMIRLIVAVMESSRLRRSSEWLELAPLDVQTSVTICRMDSRILALPCASLVDFRFATAEVSFALTSDSMRRDLAAENPFFVAIVRTMCMAALMIDA
jgi:hypothetical protein